MSLHLAEIGRQVAPGSHAALVLDGAGYHVAKDLAVPHNITLVPLPPYAPELNPIENVWEYLRGNKLAITGFDSYDDRRWSNGKGAHRWGQTSGGFRKVAHGANAAETHRTELPFKHARRLERQARDSNAGTARSRSEPLLPLYGVLSAITGAVPTSAAKIGSWQPMATGFRHSTRRRRAVPTLPIQIPTSPPMTTRYHSGPHRTIKVPTKGQ